MAVYSIRDLEQLTGIKAHTLRIWEKRYGIIEPKRTPTNIRYYLDDDLKQLLNIALLNRNGIKISKIAKMSDSDITEQVAELTDINVNDQDKVDALTLSLIELDSFKFQSIMNSNISQLGFERSMMEVIYPFLEKLGLLWMSGSINQVHEKFLNFLVRQKLIGAIDQIPLKVNRNHPKVLVFLPPASDHELSLLFTHYLLQVRGFRVINLGFKIVLEDIVVALEISNPDYLFILNLDEQNIEIFLDQLVARTNKPILISGNSIVFNANSQNDQIVTLAGMDQTIKYLEGIL